MCSNGGYYDLGTESFEVVSAVRSHRIETPVQDYLSDCTHLLAVPSPRVIPLKTHHHAAPRRTGPGSRDPCTGACGWRTPVSVEASSVRCMGNLGPQLGGGSAAGALLPGLTEIREWTGRLGGSGRDLDDTGRIDLIRALEELKCAAEGAQAELAADFDTSMRARASSAGEPLERQSRGIGA